MLSLVGRGLSNKEIGRSLQIGPETVKWHLKNMFGKLGYTWNDTTSLPVTLLDGRFEAKHTVGLGPGTRGTDQRSAHAAAAS